MVLFQTTEFGGAIGDGGNQAFDPVVAQKLSRFCETYDAQIIVCSVRGMDHNKANKDKIFQLFNEAGFDTDYVASDWSATYKGGEKAPQIFEYLSRHPEIKKWILIEDDSEDVPSIMIVDSYNGMDFSDFLSLENFLRSQHLHYNDETMRIESVGRRIRSHKCQPS